jgi:signal transduction histidine kinase
MATKKNGNILVSVEDQGPGIPEESQQDVFKSFYRLEDGHLRRKSGAGLGLAISRGFIQAHGGEIWIESKENGTRVVFSLPIANGNMNEEKNRGEEVTPLE